jgi:hypothetical protein
MTDRHKFGSGKILIEERILDEYLKIVNKNFGDLEKSKYSLTTVITDIPKTRIYEIENEK